MKINSSDTVTGNLFTQKERQQHANTQNPQAAGHQDTVSLTNAGAQLQRLEAALKDQPITNAQRVEKIQQAITEGSLRFNPAQIANKLMNFEDSLNHARSAG